MILYTIELDEQAEKDKAFWKKNSPRDYRKLLKLIQELREHPTWGTGNPKTLRTDRTKWAREINKKDRLIYKIHNREIYVYIYSARGHYDDH